MNFHYTDDDDDVDGQVAFLAFHSNRDNTRPFRSCQKYLFIYLRLVLQLHTINTITSIFY